MPDSIEGGGAGAVLLGSRTGTFRHRIEARIQAAARAEALRQGRTMSELVETALRLSFQPSKNREDLMFRRCGTLVDVADRDVLY